MIRLTVALLFLSQLRAVTPFPAGSLIYEPAHFFNLSGRRIHFAPVGPNSYKTTSGHSPSVTAGSTVLKPGAIALPFPFPFGGRTWREVYVNLNGNLTFAGPENPDGHIDTWPTRTLHWLASRLDSRAAADGAGTIAPFWGHNSPAETRITSQSSGREFIITWDAVRLIGPGNGYPPLGHSIFQLHLSPDGAIEFRYGAIAEKDALVGVFPGLAPPARIDTAALGPNARVEVDDAGTDLRFTIRTPAPLPEKYAKGKLSYHVQAISGDVVYRLGINIDAKGRTNETFCGLINPDHTGYYDECVFATVIATTPNTVAAYVPKIALRKPGVVEWQALTTVDGATTTTGDYRAARYRLVDNRFSAKPRTAAGAIFEIFHYPYLPKSPARILKTIYQQIPPEEDFALILTDFRVDDVHNSTGSAAVGAVGNDFSFDPEGQFRTYGSGHLQLAMFPWYLGPQCVESPPDPPRVWRNYAFCIGTLAHEIGHRWMARADWKGPVPDRLYGDDFHWSRFLNTPVKYPVSPLFTDAPYPEESIMGGIVIQMSAADSGTGKPALWQAPVGLSALDLYLMGMIDASDVPDTVLVSGSKRRPDGDYEGGDLIPVKIADIIAAGGPRKPPAAEAQHRFTFRIYVLHEGGLPDPVKLKMAQGAEAMLVKYFDVATGGRMTLVPLP